MIKPLVFILICSFFSSCTQENSQDIQTSNVIANKLVTLNKLEYSEVIKHNSIMKATIIKFRNEQNSKKLDSIKININSLTDLMVVTVKNIDSISDYKSLNKISNQWTDRYDELKLNKLELDSSYSNYPLNVAKQFLKNDVMYCTYQNLYEYAIKLTN